MRSARFWPYVVFLCRLACFVIPLIGMFEFSLRKRRGVYSFDAYTSVLTAPQFQQTFLYSLLMDLVAIFVGCF
jgi:putative spermidine/putrescine transport system permease protein